MKTGRQWQGTFKIYSPAKITPQLRVVARRENGYHEVRLTLVPISLYDTLEFGPRISDTGSETAQLEVHSMQSLGPESGNLVLRAAHVFQEVAGRSANTTIRLIKRIPVGAGLGGGSGNAAATLLALNRIHGNLLSDNTLREAAVSLGMDVPFFLDPHPARACGLGEQLVPLCGFPQLSLLVVQPSFTISTAATYREVIPTGLRDLREATTVATVAQSLVNDFEPSLFAQHPVLEQIRDQLLAGGALGAGLSGTGSAVFGIYSDPRARDEAQCQLQLPPGFCIWPCESLATHVYEPLPIQ